MQKIKYTLATIGASLALMLGLALPAGAIQMPPIPGDHCVDNSCNDTETKNIDNSVTLGDCSIYGSVNQSSSSNAGGSDVEANGDDGGDGGDVEKEGTGGAGGAGGAGGSATQTNTATATNSISLDCSTTNVTNAAAPQVLAATTTTTAQVSAPKGAVSAGAGGGATSSVSSVLAMAGSVVTMGLGFAVRKFNV